MNTNGIISNIAFPKLKKLGLLDFLEYADKCNLYSNEEFVEYFKDNGFWYWSSVVCYTNLNIDTLFEKYKEYLNDFEMVEHLIGRMNDYWKRKKDQKAKKVVKNIENYITVYLKYNKEIMNGVI